MKRAPRLSAVLVAFAILWTALAPLTGAVHDAWSGEVEPLCHQAGMAVEAGSMPMSQPADQGPARQVHCPLCIMVVYGAFGAEPVIAPFAYSEPLIVRVAEGLALERRFAIALPQGRAPPASLPT